MDERTKLQVEVWKTTVQVQQHFNDIELRVRGLALTVLTAALGATALAVRDGTEIEVFGLSIKLGTAVLGAALVAWLGFYFVDQVWYHRLLIGAVRHAERLEDLLESDVPAVGLTHSISEASPYQVSLGFWRDGCAFTLHSAHKLRLFYGLVAVLLLVLAFGVQLSASPPTVEGGSGRSASATTIDPLTRTSA